MVKDSMNKIISPLLIIFLSSCTLFYKKPNSTNISTYQAKTLPQLIKTTKLTQEIAGGNYKISVVPITKKYLTLLVEDISKLRGFNKKEKQVILDNYNNKYTNNKTCFEFFCSVIGNKKAAILKNWNIKFLTRKGNAIDIKLENNPNNLITAYSNRDINGLSWINNTIGCIEPPIDSKYGFAIKAIAPDVHWPLTKEAIFTWNNYNHKNKIPSTFIFRHQIDKLENSKIKSKYRLW